MKSMKNFDSTSVLNKPQLSLMYGGKKVPTHETIRTDTCCTDITDYSKNGGDPVVTKIETTCSC